ncbi:uncharacterized protein FTJAE_4551 [Fusarium tjaetaba]|uniref:2EXR domain-containing protein n=1 Tax=Fusarium tjaetaba TaxID=1567544 RepID=A0A8H5RVV4_9HYPO|nr:uncharacterized protein FTJAE_4551 [Fusarium tjaetaba]KAF5640005.1 hypothetical protein FTJAE_4551 [Fusarium tjaetaba]
MAEFKRFSELPRELRDHIWSMAIRDDRPGVHIFGQYDTSKRFAKGSRFLRSGNVVSDTWAEPSWRRYFENLNQSRSDENISTYLIDGGLWTACQESRLIMEKRFEQSKRKRYDEHTGPRYDESKKVFRKATTGCFAGTPLELMTVFPHRDLFVLQSDDLKTVDWSFIGYEASMATSAEGFRGVRHVAIEYNPKWACEIVHGGCLSDEIWAIKQAAFEAWDGVWKIWFIDTSLKRKKDAPALREEAENYHDINAFYASDRRFVEVDCNNWHDLEKEWEYIKPVEDISDDGFSSSIFFLHDLESDLYDQPFLTYDNYQDPYCAIGILGWEEL